MMTLVFANLAAAQLVLPAYRSVARWTGWYVALSLGAALLWIVLVSIGQAWQRRQSTRSTANLPATPIWILGPWQRRPHELAQQLLYLDESLAPGSSPPGRELTAVREQPAALDSERPRV